jgi:hypothetical protein
MFSDLHSRGGCQVAERDYRNRSLWVNLWVRIRRIPVAAIATTKMAPAFMVR